MDKRQTRVGAGVGKIRSLAIMTSPNVGKEKSTPRGVSYSRAKSKSRRKSKSKRKSKTFSKSKKFKAKTSMMTLETPPILLEMGYEFIKLIGKGGFAKVYLAWCRLTEMAVAIKAFDLKVPHLQGWIEKGLNAELNITLAVRHANLMQGIARLKLKDTAYLVMPYMGKGSVKDVIIRGAIPERQSRLWFLDIVSGLDYLHYHNIVHRDLKPDNFLLDARNHVRVGDFGFAAIRHVPRAKSPLLQQQQQTVLQNNIISEEPQKQPEVATTINSFQEPQKCFTMCGTTEYMAPEIHKININSAHAQEKEEEEAWDEAEMSYDGKKSDIWALGVSLFEMVNGFQPFKAKTLEEYYRMQCERQYRFQGAVKLTRMCISIIHLLLSPNPSDRPHTRAIIESNWLVDLVKRMEFKRRRRSLLRRKLELERLELEEKAQRKTQTATESDLSTTSSTVRRKPSLTTTTEDREDLLTSEQWVEEDDIAYNITKLRKRAHNGGRRTG